MRKNIKIQSYAEVGCPQWGLFEIVKKIKLNNSLFKEKKKLLGKKCKINNVKNCILFKKEKTNFKIINYENLPILDKNWI